MNWWTPYQTLAQIPAEYRQSLLPLSVAAKLATVPLGDLQRAVAGMTLRVFVQQNGRTRVRVDHLRAYLDAQTTGPGGVKRPRQTPKKHLIPVRTPAETRAWAKGLIRKYYGPDSPKQSVVGA